jgi:hypothetical protein
MAHHTSQSKPRQSGRPDDDAASQRERDRHSLIAIAQRAYQISWRRGFVPGREADDWLQAERELATRSGPPSHEDHDSD